MQLPPLYPPSDHAEFLGLKPEVRERAWRLYEAAEIVHAAGKQARVATCKAIAAERKVSWKTVYEPVRAFIQSGDWRVLIDRRRHSELWISSERMELPHAFAEFWRGLVENNQRAAKPAYDLLLLRLAAWRRGDISAAIPGYAVPPPNAKGCRHPRKWSYRDLLRVGPNDIELAATRAGRTAALKLCPAVLTTRMGGYPMQEIQFDDMFHDVQVVYGTQLVRILEFAGIDWYSTYHFPPVLKPRVNLDGVNKSLSEKEFRAFAVHFARTVGWSPRGTVYRGELGLCAFRSGLAEKLRHWSGGKITVAEPGLSGTAALAGGFREVAKGNPNSKALKESRGKLVHNYLAALPGQTGMNPANMPASSAGRNLETASLIALQGVTGRALNLAHKTFAEGVQLIFQVNTLINQRHDHKNEGWQEENLITQELCADAEAGLWLPVTAENRDLYAIIAAAEPERFRTRQMSAAEVLLPALGGNMHLTREAAFDCIHDDCKRECSVTAGRFEFSDQTYGPGKFRYPARYQDRSGFEKMLPNGADYHLVVNPFDTEVAGIFQPNGQYLGCCRRDHGVTRGDEDAVHRAMGEKQRIYKDATLAASVRHGLKRERDLTANAAALMESLRDDVRREMGILPQPTTRPQSAPSAPSALPDLSDLSDLSDFPDGYPDDAPDFSEPPPSHSHADAMAILLGDA